MRVYIFSIAIFLYLIFCINVSLTKKVVVPEYHFTEDIYFSKHGCEHHKKPNNVQIKYASVKDNNNLKKRQNRQPLKKPFQPIYDFGNVSNFISQRVKNITEYAFSIFEEVFDFYEPLKVKVYIDHNPENHFYGSTAPPVLYALKDPLENMTIAYPLPLVKQLNLDKQIDFSNNEYDLLHHLDIDFLEEKNTIIDVVIFHEMLHGFGLTSQIRSVTNGDVNSRIPLYHEESKYYMPELLEHDKKEESLKTIESFVPVSIWERHFVEYNNPNKYFFTDKFNSITKEPLNLNFHDPMFYSEKNQVKTLEETVRKWEGLQEGINFYEKSHQFGAVGFKTKEGRVVPIVTSDDGDPDLHHVDSRNKLAHKEDIVDENFAMYPSVIMHQKVNEIISEHKLGPRNKHGYLSDDLISILETMGYHKKGTPPNNRVYQVIDKHEVDKDKIKKIVDKNGPDTTKNDKNDKTNNTKEEESSAKSSYYYQSFILIIFILFSFLFFV